MRWAGHVTRVREMRNAYKVLVRKSEGKIQLGAPKCIFSLLSKNEIRLIKSPVSLSMCPTVISFEPHGRFS
jgi:hypothetical protein